VTIDGATDPLKPGGTAADAHLFVGPHEHRIVDAGHNLPQQAPQPFADAVIEVRDWLRGRKLWTKPAPRTTSTPE
jgi:hypothetical protein